MSDAMSDARLAEIEWLIGVTDRVDNAEGHELIAEIRRLKSEPSRSFDQYAVVSQYPHDRAYIADEVFPTEQAAQDAADEWALDDCVHPVRTIYGLVEVKP